MDCGKLEWWREPTSYKVLTRYGEAEHLLVQGDFVLQAYRNPRMEYAIPGASKNPTGNTGYADIVAMATLEIWEIKPESEVKFGPEEAAWYVLNALKSCGPGWKAGTGYTTLNGTGVVYVIAGEYAKAELVAEQRGPGVVVYYWRIDGKKQEKLPKKFVDFVREKVVMDYFPRGMVPLPNARPKPYDVKPGKWKPPLLLPDSLLPEIFAIPGPGPALFRAAILRMVLSTKAQRIFDGGAIAFIVPEAVVDQIVGPAKVARQMAMMQVHSDPTVQLYRTALLAITALGAGGQGAVGAAIVLGWALTGVSQLGGSLLLETKAVSVTMQTATSKTTLIDSFLAAARASLLPRAAVADGASLLMFATPHPDPKDPTKPVSISISVPVSKVLTPREAQNMKLGQIVPEGMVVALLRTGPD